MHKISKTTKNVIEKLFPEVNQETVCNILIEECTEKLPLARSEGYERIHLAILKISSGDIGKFLEAAELTRRDWRDVLMWAEFGDDLEAHLKWAAKLCSFCEG
jgi:hypothetical protein